MTNKGSRVEEHIRKSLQTRLYDRIHYVAETDSTNDLAKSHAKAGAREGTVIVADRQRQGRGRRGRPWQTESGQALLFSIVLRPPIPPQRAPLLVFLAAASVRAALAPYGDTFIKWPNDVVTEDDRKLCGILVELDAERDRIRHCIVGIGLNVTQTRDDFPESLRDTAASVTGLHGAPVDRMTLLPAVLDEFARRYDGALRNGFAPVLDEVRRYSATLGRPVRVHEAAGGGWNGTAVDVGDDGALLVKPAAGESGAPPVPVYAAEVSIRMEDVANDSS